MCLKLEHASEMVAAETLGTMILNMDKLLKGVAENAGARMSVFIESIKQESKSVEIRFALVRVAQPKD